MLHILRYRPDSISAIALCAGLFVCRWRCVFPHAPSSGIVVVYALFAYALFCIRIYSHACYVIPLLSCVHCCLTRPRRYVRLNRRRLKGSEGIEESVRALSVLHSVLLDTARLMAPFTPFLSELHYQTLRGHIRLQVEVGATSTSDQVGTTSTSDCVPGTAGSVHWIPIPDYDESRVDTAMERAVELMQNVIELGRNARDKRRLNLKTPVRNVIIAHRDPAVLAEIEVRYRV